MTDIAKDAETILVVDGDIIVRSVIADYLRSCGYRVIEAHDGREAQQALQHTGFAVDIVLSDVDLPPDMTGFTLASWVRQNKPDVTVLLSAAAQRTANIAGDLCEDGPQLAKPYEPSVVIEQIKQLRAGARAKT